MQQYVDHVEEFLKALISHEAMPEGARPCQNCMKSLTLWRCRDCILATPWCWTCMHNSHLENPFHRIERWNGAYYRPAELRDVSTYLFIQHHIGEEKCETLKRWCNILDSAELSKDRIEQEELQQFIFSVGQEPVLVADPDPNAKFFQNRDFDMDKDNNLDDDLIDYEGDDLGDGDEEMEDENPHFPIAGAGARANARARARAMGDPAIVSLTVGSLLRVVHTNGIHHIPMVSCQCHGDDVLPLNLFAAQLLPASLKRIKTIFMAQVLGHFRLCNLELKASTYQFYQLLHWLTSPMAPAEVLNLYQEFCRMTQIWRWMKRLKWSGYAGTSKKVKEVKARELAIFCRACPQPGIYIPEN